MRNKNTSGHIPNFNNILFERELAVEHVLELIIFVLNILCNDGNNFKTKKYHMELISTCIQNHGTCLDYMCQDRNRNDKTYMLFYQANIAATCALYVYNF